MIPDDIKRQLKLPGLGQLGYIVTDINKTIAYYRDTFGIGPWMLLDERPNPCIEKGKGVAPLFKIALAYTGSVQVELIQIVKGESFHLDHVKESKGGVHHLGFMVQDLDKRLDACDRAGIGILQKGTIRDMGFIVDYAYLDTADQAGIIIEFIQWRLGPIPLPINRLTFNVVCWAGSKTLLKGQIL
ncbi:MAG: VOC family protein [Deltaproteobacteria bacterium]|nr:VOC family protein [Deltaproteobacteria bacterium]